MSNQSSQITAKDINSFTTALNYIENYTWSTTRLGLSRTEELLEKLGNPQDKLKFIHVAGSNGKGSTCAMLSSILSEAGLKTGFYLSPHLCDYRERFQIDGKNISEKKFVEVTKKVAEAADLMEDHPSQFEISTAIAFLYFHLQGCDIVVLEVGMGGLLDSTNVINSPELAVICNIGLDHTEFLGTTLGEIAKNKAGIIKAGTHVVSYRLEEAALTAVRSRCKALQVPLYIANFEQISIKSQDLSGQIFTYYDKEYALSLLGKHQCKNAAVAIEAVNVLRSCGYKISDEALCQGLTKAKWPARFELLSENPIFILDGGHNVQCAQALMQALSDYLPGEKVRFILGILGDKDVEKVVEILSSKSCEFLCLTPDSERALPAHSLVKLIEKTGFKAKEFDSAESCISFALMKEDRCPTIAFGSLYMAGEIRNCFAKAFQGALRKRGIEARNSLSEKEVADFSKSICEKIISGEPFKKAKKIFVYKAIKNEVNLDLLIDAAAELGKEVYYPLCEQAGYMRALMPKKDAIWSRGSFGILEPKRKDSVEIDASELDLVICPLVCFDESGNRIGMGGGFYDRFLPKAVNARIVGVAFDCQRTKSIPVQPHDFVLPEIITEKK